MSKNTKPQKIIKGVKKGLTKIYKKGKKILKDHPEYKGVIGTVLAAIAVYEGSDIVNPKYQIAQIETPTGIVQEGEYGFIKARGENDPKVGIDEKVWFATDDGDVTKIPYANVSVISDSFSEQELKKYSIVYKLTSDAELIAKGKSEKIKTQLKAGTVVIGNGAREDGYVEIRTDNGLTGKISNTLLTKILVDLPKKKTEKPKKTGNEKYSAVNGEVIGIDVNTSAVNLDEFEKILTGDLKSGPIGAIEDTKPNYVYIKIGGYYAEYEKHIPVWNSNDYSRYMKKVVDMVELCKKHKVNYGFYFYSTAITEKEAKEEADLINQKLDYFKDNGVDAPALPLAIDIETKNGYDRQKSVKGDKQAIINSSKARAQIFNNVLKKHGNYVSMSIYTNQNVTGAIGHNIDKIIDLTTLVNNIDNMDELPVWWVAPLGVRSSDRSANAIDNVTTAAGKKIHIYGRQIKLDTSVRSSFLIDYDIIYEDDYLNFLGYQPKQEIEANVSETNLSILNSAMIGYRPKHRTKLYGIGKGKDKGYIDESTQLIGRTVPDGEGKVIVVTRDGRKGKVNLAELDLIQNLEKEEEEEREEI